MNNAIDKRFCVAFYLEPRLQADSEFFRTQGEAIVCAKREIRKAWSKHRERLYAEISNCMNHKAKVVKVEFEISDM